MKVHNKTDGQVGPDFMPHPNVHSCSGCDKSFSSAAFLEEHARIHAKERPFSCTECGKLFTQAAAMKKHMEIHTRDNIATYEKDNPTFY
jgi:uncharacterized Zn-finger protein